MEKQLEIKQNPFDDTPKQEVSKQAPVVNLTPKDPEILKTNIKNLQLEIALGLEEKKKFDASVRDYGNITLNDLPLDEQAVINSLPEKQEKLKVYQEAYEKRTPKTIPLFKKVLEATRKTMRRVAGIFPSF